VNVLPARTFARGWTTAGHGPFHCIAAYLPIFISFLQGHVKTVARLKQTTFQQEFEGMAVGEQHTFKAEIQQLLNILVHSLYTDREVFLRELISNASDALSRLQFEQLTNSNILDADAPLEIRIRPDEAAGTLTISDTGIGMNQDELANNLGVIAHSGAKAFIEALQDRKDGPVKDLIGQFGVGFY